MKLASRLTHRGARGTAADAGRDALRSAGRGARKGAKRGAGIGAAKGAGNSVAKETRSRLSDVGDSVKTTTDRIASTARSARERTRASASRVAETARRGRRPGKKQTIVTATAAGAAGAAGAYFLDPNDGKRRRHVARDRIAALVRHEARSLRRQAEYRKGEAVGVVEQALSKLAPAKPAPNDQDLADRVRSELFRPADAPKGSVNVNAEHGVIYLRGEAATAEQREQLAEIAAKIDGVQGVKNLLHLPGEAAKAKS